MSDMSIHSNYGNAALSLKLSNFMTQFLIFDK